MPLPPAGSPGSKKRTFSAKVAISLQRGANFQILDFGTPLEKSVSLTFSEQWLCHFSKDSGGVFPVGAHGSGKPHANFVHGGTVADIYNMYVQRMNKILSSCTDKLLYHEIHYIHNNNIDTNSTINIFFL